MEKPDIDRIKSRLKTAKEYDGILTQLEWTIYEDMENLLVWVEKLEAVRDELLKKIVGALAELHSLAEHQVPLGNTVDTLEKALTEALAACEEET